MSEVVEVVVTGPADWVRAFSDAVVADRLAACVHQVAIDSVYRWEGEVEHDREVRAMMHTSAARLDELTERIDREHPYDLPCILTVATIPSPGYANWVRESTAP
ncbi:divalent-cation tolerance protein CutA [Janibacter sp. YIM B02568]|uniref:divalent-cation tolerance protein CutA n=1 Tax=Janibacter endophyticus TaxID=2806261 RepID=UPI00194E461A|nr:divalent-cation tolerance protein CutA [Janibacter endophyticus]MBM6544637.1 divalent-cation tolerance protein CutA [Janibacter endophyticus]